MVYQVEFLPRPQHEIHPLDVGNLGGFQLRITSNHHHKCVRVALHCAADSVSTFGVRVVRDAARVDDHDVRGIIDGHPRIACARELPRQGARFAEVEFASERVKRRFLSQNHGSKNTIERRMQLPGLLPC